MNTKYINEKQLAALNSLRVGGIYNSQYGVIRYDGEGLTSAINARSGNPRLVTCGMINNELLNSLSPSEMSSDDFEASRKQSTLAVSEFYESTRIEP
jgi:hypothetical protein